MRANGGGSIVNVASVMGLRSIGQIPDAAYVASKAGIIGLTRELASQWGRYGIRVNAVAPGFFASEMTAELGDDPEAFPAFLLERTPLGRGGRAGELDAAVLFLLGARQQLRDRPRPERRRRDGGAMSRVAPAADPAAEPAARHLAPGALTRAPASADAEQPPAGRDERRDEALRVVEAGADHRAAGRARGDALADDRELEERERLVPVDVGDVEAGPRGVALDRPRARDGKPSAAVTGATIRAPRRARRRRPPRSRTPAARRGR